MLFKATWFALFASLGPMLETLGGTGRTLPLLQGGVGAPERQLLGGLMEGGREGGIRVRRLQRMKGQPKLHLRLRGWVGLFLAQVSGKTHTCYVTISYQYIYNIISYFNKGFNKTSMSPPFLAMLSSPSAPVRTYKHVPHGISIESWRSEASCPTEASSRRAG